MGGDQRSASADQTLATRFTAAYDQLAPRVLGYLRSQGVEDPEAVTNEVFLGLYQRFASISGGDDGVRTMTFSIAHARVVDHHRVRTSRPITVEFDADADPRTVASAEEIVVSRTGGPMSHLASLADEQREAVTLRVIAGLSLEETAFVMGKSVGSIKQLQRRGLLSLRAAITQGGDHVARI